MTSPVRYEIRDGVAVVTVDRPPVNAINVGVRAGLIEAIGRAEADAAVSAVVLTCAGRTFLSGADLGELRSTIEAPSYYEMLARIEDCAKPVVAALFGTALGGGFETAMACHYRVATPDARIGMPEINLGIVPGAGGTQRLPRLAGAREALALMVDGAPISAERAKEIGCIDTLIAGDLVAGAVAFAKQAKTPRKTRERAVDAKGFDDAGVKGVLDKAARALRGRTTQNLLVDCVNAAVLLPFAEGLALEKRVSDASLKSDEGRALIHVFFAEREAARIPGISSGEGVRKVAKAAVIGAGTMGGGIAMCFADAGIPVALIDINEAALKRGIGVIRANYEASAKRGRLTSEAVEARMAAITPAGSLDACADADLVIEAVFEDIALKKRIFAELDAKAKPGAVLASNTSTLPIAEIASATKRPGDVLGLHFFSPANVMRLLEIVRGENTSASTLATAMDIAKKLRKVGVVAGDSFGFIGNRMMLDGYFREAELLLLEGASPEQIDRVMEEFGFAMGPNRVNDMAGVDVGTNVRKELAQRQARPDPYHVVSDALTAMGRIGQKAGKGVYRYEPGDRTAYGDEETTALIKRLAAERGVVRRDNTDAEIEERCVLPLINIGAQILDEGMAYRASDIDVVWTSGYGFPRWRGGPMHYGDTLGLARVRDAIRKYEARDAFYWRPSPLLMKLADSGRSFADWDAEKA